MLFVPFLGEKAPLEIGPVCPSHQEKVWELGNLVPSKKMELAEKKFDLKYTFVLDMSFTKEKLLGSLLQDRKW